MEIMKSRLLSLQCFSFHFLTDTYWSGDHDFQLPAFKVTLSWQQGTRLRVCSLKGWVGWQGEKEDLWWRRGRGGKKKHLNGKLVKISSCLRSRSDKVFGSVASRHHFKIDSWLCTAYYWCQCCLCSSANYIRSGVVIVQDQNVLFPSLGESSLMKNILELLSKCLTCILEKNKNH